MDFQRDDLLLNGTWQWLAEHGDEELWQAEVAARQSWQKLTVPGLINGRDSAKKAQQARCFWVRRVCQVSASQAGRGVVLKSNGVQFGATVWISGRQIGQHAPMGPFTMLIPPGVIREGDNTLTMKILGWGGIELSQSGLPLIPKRELARGAVVPGFLGHRLTSTFRRPD